MVFFLIYQFGGLKLERRIGNANQLLWKKAFKIYIYRFDGIVFVLFHFTGEIPAAVQHSNANRISHIYVALHALASILIVLYISC